MRIVSIKADQGEAKFAEEATRYFESDPSNYTYTKSDPEPGEYLAIRWNSYTVLVVKLDPDHDPGLYSTYPFINDDLPRLTPKPPAD